MSEATETGGLGAGELLLVSMPPRTDLLEYLPASAGSVVVVAVRTDPREVEAGLRAKGIDPGRATVIPVALSDPVYHGDMTVTPAVRPSNLRDLGARLSAGLESATSDPVWLVFDDLIVLLMYAGNERLLEFVRAVAARVRTTDIRGVYGVDRGALSEETFRELHRYCDHHLDLREET